MPHTRRTRRADRPAASRPALGALAALALGVGVTPEAQAQAPGQHVTSGITAGSATDDTSAGGITPEQERHLTHAQIVRLRQMHRAPPGLSGAAQQNRELGQIGTQLLNGTPKQPAGSTLQTGGGTKR